MLNERKLTKPELTKREDIVKSMKDNKRDLVKKYGKDAEKVMYGRATNIAKKKTESMNSDKLKEMIEAALKNPKKADLNKDGKLSDYEKKRGAAIEKSMNTNESYGSNDDFDGTGLIVVGRTQIDNNSIQDMLDETGYDGVWNAKEGYWFFKEEEETLDALEMELEQEFVARDINARFEGQFNESLSEDLDLGHQDNEPGMLKGDLYKIGKYAMELYQIMDSLEGQGEVDFPHWWQSKIITAKNMISGAKHYLDFELKEPQIDAMVGVAAEEDAIDEGMSDEEWAKAKEEDRLAKLPKDQQAKIKKAIAMLKAEKKPKK